ncbi:MAG: hypothetical protein U1F10_13485 [Burkholderiales bacterium]
MSVHRPLLSLSAALAVALVAGCSSVPPPYLLPMWSAQAPTKYEVKEHWDLTMAGVEAQSPPATREGLALLTADARSSPMDGADRQYAMERLQRVSFYIDRDEWDKARDQLVALRWRYGRF